MKIDDLINELENVREEHGNLEVDFTKNYDYTSKGRVFVTNEDKEDYDTICWLSF